MNKEILDLNVFQGIIEVLVNNGYEIVQIINNPYNVFYYLVYSFESAYSGGGVDIRFNFLKGVNITDFLQKNSRNDARLILAKIEELITHSTVVELKFSDKVDWYKYALAK